MLKNNIFGKLFNLKAIVLAIVFLISVLVSLMLISSAYASTQVDIGPGWSPKFVSLSNGTVLAAGDEGCSGGNIDIYSSDQNMQSWALKGKISFNGNEWQCP